MPTLAPNTLALLCAADDTFAMPMSVMLYSASTNLGRGRRIAAFVVDAGFRPATRDRLRAAARRLGNVDLHWCPCDLGRLSGVGTTAQFGLSAFARLLMGDIVPPDVSRVIYLDSDLVVEGDLWDLWEAPLGPGVVKAVRDFEFFTLAHGLAQTRDTLGLPPDAPYLNSGVMVVDLPRWRRERVSEAAIAYARTYAPTLRFADQDALNAVLCGQWDELDATWNVQVGSLNRLPPAGGSPQAEWLLARRPELFAHPRVVHFVSSHKPWHAGRYRPVRPRFVRYLNRCGWHSRLGLATFHATWLFRTIAMTIRLGLTRLFGSGR